MGSSPQHVPVIVDRGSKELLVGEWVGEYSSLTVQRSGSIALKLEAGKDTAFGDVIMIPRGLNESYSPHEYPQIRRATPFVPQVLAIKFVHVADDSVHGLLAPYWDPERKITIVTSFEGKISANNITGIFTGRDVSTGNTFTGRWQVTRKILQGDDDGIICSNIIRGLTGGEYKMLKHQKDLPEHIVHCEPYIFR